MSRVGRVLLLGATSGIARAAAAEFARHGHGLVLAARDAEEAAATAADLALRFGVPADAVPLDALDFAAHEAALERCWAAAGPEGVEGVVLFVGYLGDPVAARGDAEEARRILDTNFTACAALLNGVANRMERRGSGWIAALSSVAGDRGRQSNYLYGAAKAGLTVYLQGLRNRLFHAGVRVVTVKPGFVDTGMTYGKPGMFLVASPDAVARGLYRAATRSGGTVYLPWFWRPVMWIIRAVPEPVFKRLRL